MTLHNPEFLSILRYREWYCNTAHGWTDQSVFMFDLKTGEAIDPASFLPPDIRPAPDTHDSTTFSVKKSLARVKPLTDFYLGLLATAPPNDLAELNHDDCAAILTQGVHDFQIWPDAKAHALMLMPDGLVYVDTPCQNPVAIPVALLAKLRASPRLIDALME
jgi:hypothetical protein